MSKIDIVSASIGYKDEKGYIKVVKVYKDGNPAFAGCTLYAKYQEKKKVRQLIDLGDLIYLREVIEPQNGLPHYSLKSEEGKELEERFQENVCVFKNRDFKVLDKQNFMKSIESKKTKARTYRSIAEIFYGESTDVIYIFDSVTETWETWGVPFKSERLSQLRIGYKSLIRNLECRGDISYLTGKEKSKLSYLQA